MKRRKIFLRRSGSMVTLDWHGRKCFCGIFSGIIFPLFLWPEGFFFFSSCLKYKMPFRKLYELLFRNVKKKCFGTQKNPFFIPTLFWLKEFVRFGLKLCLVAHPLLHLYFLALYYSLKVFNPDLDGIGSAAGQIRGLQPPLAVSSLGPYWHFSWHFSALSFPVSPLLWTPRILPNADPKSALLGDALKAAIVLLANIQSWISLWYSFFFFFLKDNLCRQLQDEQPTGEKNKILFLFQVT